MSKDNGEKEHKLVNIDDAVFRNWITADGSSGFKAEAGRYHLYVALICPFASRAVVGRKLKGLEDAISMDILYYAAFPDGFRFDPTYDGCTPDTVNGKQSLKEIYEKASPGYQGRCTVPTLWDKQKGVIVNNESSEILRMLNSEFNEFCKTEEQKRLDLYPEILRPEIDELNSWIAPQLNMGVYRTGFARVQNEYDVAVKIVFEGLDKLEGILEKKRYLTGNALTEADVRLFTTLIRFDTVYVGLFKCNKKRLADYPNLSGYLRDVYQIPGVKDTVNQDHITRGYYTAGNQSVGLLNPFNIVPVGPDLDFDAPHGREALSR